ncbi:Nucleic-acid-binding protein from transposon X-element [Lasiodiplodia theobromae]|uniref:Nucleic-acid-binding protein from transposon X-element n=1 Tax=Lasiodiplodia theobromae TaxID=45133 RepID=A0A5N5CVW3_9PEZI|nr:Nucleic-acid-binding protein from transposon X-element [Lasiodiplodia theobromae]
MPTKTAAEHISEALKKHDRTRDASVLGVGTTKLGYLIRFKDEEAKKLATSNTEWTKTLGNDTAITQPQFGVVVHRTPTSEVNIEKKNEAIQKILQENSLVDARIKNIAWMKKRDSPLGQHASLGIWFNTQEEAQNAIQNGLVFGQSYTNRVEPYRMERKRCHRCLQFGHLAWNCKKKERCGHCLAEHNKMDCSSEALPKCADCNQSHPTGAAQCKGAMPYPLLRRG